MATTTQTETHARVIALLERAEHASLAIASTWDHYRARRLAKLIKRYGDRAQAVIMADSAATAADYRIGFKVAYMGPTAARQARTIARSNGIAITDDWFHPLA